ncbi:HypC/HybG/HupF family hydrogenase formation chaperone [Roseovarius sp.]|uniref:HypC/HybG/HupF family hydrogenase formation chaperone n=1 Tax=Roseovarius sp. TaxID=1486281 RepID=UPI003B5B2F13
MCVGVPMQITSITGIAATVRDSAELIDLSLTPEARTGDWVLTFLGAAREVICEDEAEKICAALDGLRAVMTGGDVGNAFADLDAATPQLPPHLQAAFDAGQSTG